jgi:hypothetical protein
MLIKSNLSKGYNSNTYFWYTKIYEKITVAFSSNKYPTIKFSSQIDKYNILY